MNPFIKSVAHRVPGLAAAWARWQSRAERDQLAGRSSQAIFNDYFQRNTWGGRASRSGRGSDPEQTRAIVQALPALWAELGVRHVLDVPCGDFQWMQRVDLSAVRYTGGDIVERLIEANRGQHSRPGVSFETLDLLQGPLPPADLLLCRDCLVHLSFADARQALANIAQSDIRWLLTTTFPSRPANADIATGQWRPLNLMLAPFKLPPPTLTVVEHCTEGDGQYADKALALWRVDLVRSALNGGASDDRV